MAISSKMRRVGESVYYKEILKPKLNETVGENSYKMEPIVGKRKLIIHTDRVKDELLAEVKTTAEAAMPDGTTLKQYNHHIEVNWRDINKYTECQYVDNVKAVNPDYMNDLTSDGTWVYPLDKLINAFHFLKNPSLIRFEGRLPVLSIGDTSFASTGLTSWNVDLPNLTFAYSMYSNSQISSWNASLPKLQSPELMFYCSKLTSWNTEVPNVSGARMMFYRNPLTSVTVGFPKLSNGADMFAYCFLDKKSVLLILNSIPAYTSGWHELTIGIHIDHQNDEEALAAIASAESKGWTMRVQWTGTPTSAASTMAMGQLIYAKVGEMERPDGTTEQYLVWGHYVTNPESYETFRSLESAYSYFGLEMPNIN